MNHIPTWVYFLFVGLLYIGIKRCFTSVGPVRRLLVFPVAMLFLSFHHLQKMVAQMPISILTWILGLLIAGAFGAYYVRNRAIRANKKHGLIEIPGDWTNLVFILLVFSLEFFVNYATDSQTALSNQTWFILLITLISGIAIGFPAGRNTMYFKKYLGAEHTSLELTTPLRPR